jgi:hypothetical protein
MALVWQQRRVNSRTYLVIGATVAVGCLIIVPAAMRMQAIRHYRTSKTGYSWIYVWATIEASTAFIACNVAEFALLFATLGGRYKTPPSDMELRLVRRRDSRDGGARPWNGRRFTRHRLGPLQTPLYRKRGVRTVISVVPLEDRDESRLEATQSGILVTRDIEQRTAEDDSMYSGGDASRSQILSSFDGGSPSTAGPSPRVKSARTFLFGSHD